MRRADITVVSNPVTNLVLQGRGDRGLIRRGTTRVGNCLPTRSTRIRPGLCEGRLLSVRSR